VDVDRIGRDVVAEIVGLAYVILLDAAARRPDREAPGMMVPAVIFLRQRAWQ